MDRKSLDETMTCTATVIASLRSCLKSGLVAATANQRCGSLLVNGAAQIKAGGPAFWINLAACFESVQAAGSTYAAMDAVRVTAEALAPVTAAGIAVKNFCARMALTELARILAATTFTSRQDIDNYFDQIDAAFDRAETVAADGMDNVAYRLLISIHAAVSNDLANRARPLARMVKYNIPTQLPSLALAQRIYCDPTRADELIGENKPIHPLFMPMTGNALSG